MSVLMCEPKYFNIFYEINPWMNVNITVKEQLAWEQWRRLYETLLNLKITVHLIEPVKDLPDMVFTANAGLIHGKQILISSFKAKERQPESNYFASWFRRAGFELVNEDDNFLLPPYFEGAGDALFFNTTLIVAHGFRTDIMAYEHPFFKQFNCVLCELVNPHFYHLDTCFCPLNDSLAMWYPQAFSGESQKRMLQLGEFIDVPEEEANNFACNSVVIGNHVIMPTGCPETHRELKKHGFNVHTCEMSEFMKSGGACKCLVLAL